MLLCPSKAQNVQSTVYTLYRYTVFIIEKVCSPHWSYVTFYDLFDKAFVKIFKHPIIITVTTEKKERFLEVVCY